MSSKLFISHSSRDKDIVKQFVDMLIMIGANNDDIICSSLPNNKIPLGEYIYDYLDDTINTENLYAVLFLSDNYYRSAMCLNEMGALWVKHIQSRNILIKGFDYSDITGDIVLLMDDVTTTGNSLYACREILLERGAKCVKMFALGKAV